MQTHLYFINNELEKTIYSLSLFLIQKQLTKKTFQLLSLIKEMEFAGKEDIP